MHARFVEYLFGWFWWILGYEILIWIAQRWIWISSWIDQSTVFNAMSCKNNVCVCNIARMNRIRAIATQKKRKKTNWMSDCDTNQLRRYRLQRWHYQAFVSIEWLTIRWLQLYHLWWWCVHFWCAVAVMAMAVALTFSRRWFAIAFHRCCWVALVYHLCAIGFRFD